MEPSAHVNRVVDRIAEHVRPERIVLCGSQASGTASDESDVDLLVILPTAMPLMRQAVAICRSVDHDVPVDILMRTRERVEARNPRDFILRTVLSEGVTVHAVGT